MNIAIGLSQGLREILGNRLRSTIALLAIVLGAGSLLATLALTEGIARQERLFFQSLGGVERFSIQTAPAPVGQEDAKDLSPGLTPKDVSELLRNASSIAAVSPVHRLRPNPSLIRGSTTIYDARFTCASPDYQKIARQTLASGRYLSAVDVARFNRVCVIANGLLAPLGVTPVSALGKKVRLDGELFEIVGTLEAVPARWMEREVVIPYSTAFVVFEQRKVNATGTPAPVTQFTEITGMVADADHLESAIASAKPILLKNHRGMEDFGFNTMQDWSDNIEARINAVRVSGGVIAAVSLLVGGIGVTNVMLAAIKQRIREIGVRRAIGAHRGDIFIQIMLEAFILAVLGGVLGIFIGWLIVAGFKIFAVSKAIPIIMPTALFWSFGAALVTGVLAGIYPAMRGAAMSPMEALRYE